MIELLPSADAKESDVGYARSGVDWTYSTRKAQLQGGLSRSRRAADAATIFNIRHRPLGPAPREEELQAISYMASTSSSRRARSGGFDIRGFDGVSQPKVRDNKV